MSDLLGDLAAAMAEPVAADAWEAWAGEHGSAGGVTLEGGYRIPSAIDSVRYGIFRRGGLAAMREFDAAWAAAL